MLTIQQSIETQLKNLLQSTDIPETKLRDLSSFKNLEWVNNNWEKYSNNTTKSKDISNLLNILFIAYKNRGFK